MSAERMTDPSHAPCDGEVRELLGPQAHSRWRRILDFIEASYPGVYSPDWLYGGKNGGWGLRFKRSKALCTLTPEKEGLNALVVLGAQEREAVEPILAEFGPQVRDLYAQARTYHDGKWLFMSLEDDADTTDFLRLLAIKRKPRLKTCA